MSKTHSIAILLAALFLLVSCGDRGRMHLERADMDRTDPPAGSSCGLPRDEAELRRLLTPEQFEVLRRNGTERPFANAYWDEKRSGLYVDPITGDPLFCSTEKFDSGSGWPSFSAPIEASALVERPDSSHGMERTEVRSRGSDSHLGHLFPDGPGPEGRRYCINSAALRFIPLKDLEAEGYGAYLPLFGLPPAAPPPPAASRAQATFGAGCFWGIEAAFRSLPGVIDAESGYAGGQLENPTYHDVCTGTTGHAEVVRVTYDPAQIDYDRLLDTFWRIHDPTSLNRQGPDVGTQYRSIILFHSRDQEVAARASRDRCQASGEVKGKIVTQIAPAGPFFRAEEYHQRYLEKRGLGSCGVRGWGGCGR